MDSQNQQKQESKKLLSDFLLSLEEKGKMCFILKDLESLERSIKSLRMSLWRLSEKNRIVSPGSDFFVIVPVQYRKVGSPPALWYLNDWMKFISVNYYVGLLSAAAIHGASHQAVQETEVIVGRQIDNRTIDRIRFRFFYRKNVSNTPTQKWEVPTGYVFVSTPAATAIDIVRYMHKIGGPSHVATVLVELCEKISPEELSEAILKMAPEIPVLQRLGLILDIIQQNHLAEVVHKSSLFKAVRFVPLNTQIPISKKSIHPVWKVYLNDTVEADL